MRSIRCIAEVRLPIHNMVVVTSPMGDQAPPALAAIIIIPAYHKRSCLTFINLRNRVISTMVAVRLSITDERKNAKMAIIHSNCFLLLVFTAFFKTSKPR